MHKIKVLCRKLQIVRMTNKCEQEKDNTAKSTFEEIRFSLLFLNEINTTSKNLNKNDG